MLQGVVKKGTATRAQIPGVIDRRQDRHDRELRRRLVRRLDEGVHGRGLGRLPGRVQADEDRVPGRAGRRRHLPGRDLEDLHGVAAEVRPAAQEGRRRRHRQGPRAGAGTPTPAPGPARRRPTAAPRRPTAPPATERRDGRHGAAAGRAAGDDRPPPQARNRAAPRTRRRRRPAGATEAAVRAPARRPATAGRAEPADAAGASAAAQARRPGPRDVSRPERAEAPRQLRGLRDPDPRAASRRAAARPASRSGSGRTSRSVSLSSARSPSAWVSLPGPVAQPGASARAARASAPCPTSGSSARIRTAAPTPSGSQTAFSSAWMPYER